MKSYGRLQKHDEILIINKSNGVCWVKKWRKDDADEYLFIGVNVKIRHLFTDHKNSYLCAAYVALLKYFSVN